MISITVQNLGKKFKLFGSPGKRLTEYISMGKFSRHTDFWALQNGYASVTPLQLDLTASTQLAPLGAWDLEIPASD